MKRLTVLLMLLAAAGIHFVLQGALHTQAEASLSPERSRQIDRASGVAPVDPLPAKQPVQPRAASAELKLEGGANADLALARIASECGDHLFEKARRSPDNKHLLNQTVQHYRACLAHEPTCPDGGALFRHAKARIEQLERLLARADRPPSPSPAPAPKAVVDEKPASQVPADEEPKMVGPDGVIYKRLRR